ncbi:MAG: oligosaccharide flippase family protein [Epsilonproteobacteria bacterium]|nr:oligosaccharide flippase family protein [Campylobacterota bacterium]
MWQRAKSFLLLLSSEILARGISFVVIIFIAKKLGAVELGYWSYALALNSFLILLSNLGLDLYALVELSKNSKNKGFLLSNLFFLKSLLFFLVLLLLLPLFFVIEAKVFIILLLLFISEFFNSLIPKWFFQSQGNISILASIRITQAIGYLIFIFVLFKIEVSIYFLALGYIFSNLITFVLFLKSFSSYLSIKNIKITQWKNILKRAIVLGGALFVTQIYGNIDKVMIATMLGKKEAGLYEAGYKLYSIVLVVFSLLWTIYASKIVKDKGELSKFIFFLFLIAFSIAFFLFTFSKKIILLLYSPDFLATHILLRLFSVLLIIMVFSYGYSSVLSLYKQDKAWLIIAIICAGVNILLNFYLIPSYGIQGALVATIFSEVIMATGSYLILRKVFIKDS